LIGKMRGRGPFVRAVERVSFYYITTGRWEKKILVIRTLREKNPVFLAGEVLPDERKPAGVPVGGILSGSRRRVSKGENPLVPHKNKKGSWVDEEKQAAGRVGRTLAVLGLSTPKKGILDSFAGRRYEGLMKSTGTLE